MKATITYKDWNTNCVVTRVVRQELAEFAVDMEDTLKLIERKKGAPLHEDTLLEHIHDKLNDADIGQEVGTNLTMFEAVQLVYKCYATTPISADRYTLTVNHKGAD